MDEYYRILKVKPGASLDDIRESYLKLVQIWHPDHNPTHLKAYALEETKQINIAYEKLKKHLESGTRGTRQQEKRQQPCWDQDQRQKSEDSKRSKGEYVPGCAAYIILEIIRRATRERASTMKNLLARVTEEEAGAFVETRIRDAKKRLKKMMYDYISRGLVERHGDFYKAVY
ncbi:MAG: J domain-containing protein [Syntrophobacteraceae bacterium]